MPLYQPPQYGKTGIPFVDALVRAVASDPTVGTDPSIMAAPAVLIPRGSWAPGLIHWLERAAPGLHKAAQRAPDITVEYPTRNLVPAAAASWNPMKREILVGNPGARANFVHELLHALYGGKRAARAAKAAPGTFARDPWLGQLPWFQVPPTTTSKRIAERYAKNLPQWYIDQVAANVGADPTMYWGELAIEALAQNVMNKIRQREAQTALEFLP